MRSKSIKNVESKPNQNYVFTVSIEKTNVSSTRKSSASRGNSETKKLSYNIDEWQSMSPSDILPYTLIVEMELSQLESQHFSFSGQ